MRDKGARNGFGDLPSPQVTIETGSPADLPHLLSLEQQGMTSPWSSAALAQQLENPGSELLVAIHAQTHNPIGYVAIRRVAGEAEILRLTVEPHFRGRGIASQLLATILRRLRENATATCFLEVRDDNSTALALYRRFSFRILYRRPSYYADGCAALVLATDLEGLPPTDPS